MKTGTYEWRAQLAASLETWQDAVARDVTEVFLARHPDWLDRYGERARLRGIEDAVFHIRFLAGSIAAGEPSQFADYARWTAGVLENRGIQPAFLAENLEQVRDALSERLNPEQAAFIAPYVAAGLDALRNPAPESVAGETESPLGLTCSLYTQAIVKGERSAAITIIEETLRSGANAVDVYVDVLQEAQYHVGRQWERNAITVAQEHMATAITQLVIARLYAHLEPAAEHRGRMILTGTHGELHQVGAMMLADVLEADGWDVRFLGTNMPHEGIVQAVDDHRPDILGISTTMLFNVPRVRELMAACRALPGMADLPIVVGGGAFRASPALYSEIGANAYAPDLRTAREALRAL